MGYLIKVVPWCLVDLRDPQQGYCRHEAGHEGEGYR